MKALTLHQPHAHLIGHGPKMFETRSWKTNFRGLIAIHAAQIQNHELDAFVVDPKAAKPIYRDPYHLYLPDNWNDYFGGLNHGGVEALVQLVEIYDAPDAYKWLLNEAAQAQTDEDAWHYKQAAAFGDFSAGRYAWYLVPLLVLSGCEGLVRGRQGLWTLPKDPEEKLLRAFYSTTGDMICRHCGCLEDDPCIDPTTGTACHWVSDHLCSACAEKEAA